MKHARGRPVVYIASAYSGDIRKNTELSRKYSKFAVRMGYVPLNPILNLAGVLSDETDRDTALEIDLALLRKAADQLFVFGEPTAGMKLEIAEAEKLNIRTRYFTEQLEEIT